MSVLRAVQLRRLQMKEGNPGLFWYSPEGRRKLAVLISMGQIL